MLDTVKINHVQHISFTQSRLTDAVSVILSELLSYEHPSKSQEIFFSADRKSAAGSVSRRKKKRRTADPGISCQSYGEFHSAGSGRNCYSTKVCTSEGNSHRTGCKKTGSSEIL